MKTEKKNICTGSKDATNTGIFPGGNILYSKPFIFSFPPILTNHLSFFQKIPSGADIFPILHFLARPDAPDLVSRPTR